MTRSELVQVVCVVAAIGAGGCRRGHPSSAVMTTTAAAAAPRAASPATTPATATEDDDANARDPDGPPAVVENYVKPMDCAKDEEIKKYDFRHKYGGPFVYEIPHLWRWGGSRVNGEPAERLTPMEQPQDKPDIYVDVRRAWHGMDEDKFTRYIVHTTGDGTVNNTKRTFGKIEKVEPGEGACGQIGMARQAFTVDTKNGGYPVGECYGVIVGEWTQPICVFAKSAAIRHQYDGAITHMMQSFMLRETAEAIAKQKKEKGARPAAAP